MAFNKDTDLLVRCFPWASIIVLLDLKIKKKKGTFERDL